MVNLSPIPIGSRSQLTEVRSTDKDLLVEYLKSREIYDNTLRIPFPYQEGDAEQWIDFNQALRNEGKILSWAIRNPEGLLLGGIGFNDAIDIGITHKSEIGYWLALPFWGQGIMTQVLTVFVDIALRNYQLSRVTATVFASNVASCRVVEKCGFVFEGLMKNYYLKDGRLIDGKLYSRCPIT